MTVPEAGACFMEYDSGASGRQCEPDWFCIPPGPGVSGIITREESNEDHTVRRTCGWTTKVLPD